MAFARPGFPPEPQFFRPAGSAIGARNAGAALPPKQGRMKRSPEEALKEVIDLFKQGLVGPDDVWKMTTASVNRCGTNWQAAMACIDAVWDCRHPTTKQVVYPNCRNFSVAIRVCGNARRPDKALELFNKMQSYGIYTDIIVYKDIISVCKEAGRVEDVLWLFDHMNEHGPKWNVYPDASIYSLAISACEKAGLYECASAVRSSGQTRPQA